MTLSPIGDRTAFLARVRGRIGDGLPHNPLRPIRADGAPALIDYAVDVHDRVIAFRSALEALGGTVDDVADRDDYVRRVVDTEGARRVVVSRDPECDGLGAVLSDHGMEVVELGDTAAAAGADLGITGAEVGIALTGSVVMDSSRAGARGASLLPPTHLVLLRRDRLLGHPGEYLRRLGQREAGPLPSNIVLVTGPSKSADIELILTVGVHGPRKVIVGLLYGPST